MIFVFLLHNLATCWGRKIYKNIFSKKKELAKNIILNFVSAVKNKKLGENTFVSLQKNFRKIVF
jgi:hypothetical protein